MATIGAGDGIGGFLPHNGEFVNGNFSLALRKVPNAVETAPGEDS
jgi:hypothetical protein